MSTDKEPNPYASPAEMGSISALGTAETLRRVATGLNLVYWGIGIILLAIIIGMVGLFIAPAVGVGAMVVVAILPIGIIAGTIIGFIGRILCLAVPPQTNAQGLIYGAVICDLIAVGLAIAQFVDQSQWLRSAANLLSLVATILFILFLKRVSWFVGRRDLADDAQALIVLGVVLFAAVTGGAFLAVVLKAPAIIALLGLAMIVLGLVMLVKYIRLLRELRLAIEAQT